MPRKRTPEQNLQAAVDGFARAGSVTCQRCGTTSAPEHATTHERACGRCHFGGCKNPVTHRAATNWGNRITFNVCDQHVPGSAGDLGTAYMASLGLSPADGKAAWYDVEPLDASR